jgi:transposase-like protein
MATSSAYNVWRSSKTLEVLGMAYRKSDDLDQRIVDLYVELKDGNKVAKELGFNDRTVYRVLAQRGVDTRAFRSGHLLKFKGESLGKLIEEYEGGCSTADLATKYSCARITILDALARAGVEIRGPKPRMTDEEKLKVIELYKSGLNFKEVAVAAGRSEGTVMQLIHKHPEIVRPNGPGPRSPTWGGGKFTHRGYVYAWVSDDDPMVSMRGTRSHVLEHRLVLARKLGRPLLVSETVHHIDGDKVNNAPENLELRQGKHGKHVVMCCLDCGSRNIGHVALS